MMGKGASGPRRSLARVNRERDPRRGGDRPRTADTRFEIDFSAAGHHHRFSLLVKIALVPFHRPAAISGRRRSRLKYGDTIRKLRVPAGTRVLSPFSDFATPGGSSHAQFSLGQLTEPPAIH